MVESPYVGTIRQIRQVQKDMQASALKQANRLLDRADLFLAGEILMGHLARLSPQRTMSLWEEICEQIAVKECSIRLSFSAVRDEFCSVYRTADIGTVEGRVLEQMYNPAISGRFIGSRNKHIELTMTTS